MTDQVTTAAVQSWLAAHEPQVEFAPRAFAAMVDALPGGKQVAAVPSGAIIGGDAVNYAKADAAIKEAGSDLAELTRILADSPINGCTTVMDIALKHSKYNPLDPTQAGNFAAYLKYVQAIVTAPFFHLNFADTKKISEQSQNWDNLINSIADLFDDVTTQDKTRIVTGLKKLAHAATSTSDKMEKLNIFSQSAIAQNSSAIIVAIYYSDVEMIEHEGKHTTRQADYTINRSVMTFRDDQWPVFAPEVAKRQVTRVDDWLNANNSA